MSIDLTVLKDILADANWLPHRYDPQHDAFHFINASRSVRRQATFLVDDDLANTGLPSLIVTRRDAIAALDSDRAPVHFLFHSAFCCSTLLARALDHDGIATMFSEPVVLNDLVGWRRRGAAPAQLTAVIGDTLRLLARPFIRGEAVVIKPSNIVSVIAGSLLAADPRSRAIALHAPLDTFVTSVAKKGLDGRLWVRGVFAGLMADGIADLGFTAAELFGQSDLQIAALGWLAQQRHFQRLSAPSPRAPIRSLSSDRLLAGPGAAIAAAAALFALPIDAAGARSIERSEVFSRHSKSGDRFDAQTRRKDHDDAAQHHATEIERVVGWAREVARHQDIMPSLPSPLLP